MTDWLRNCNTMEFLGVWERVYNPNFNYGEFATIRKQSGLNRFKISVKEFVARTLEGYLADGVEPAKPYSGKLNLRMSSELHSRVAAIVASTGTTINDFINRAIKNELKKVAAL